MQLVDFHGRRVGFWMAQDAAKARDELTPSVTPMEHGRPEPAGVALVVAAADPDDRVAWAHVVYAPFGAALCVTWGGRLAVGAGPKLVVLEGDGSLAGRYDAGDDELVSAWTVDEGLLLLGRRAAHLMDGRATPAWVRPLEAEGLVFLGAAAGTLRVALLGADDWREVSIGARDGTLREAGR
jgi:hypothetical protein